MIRLAYVEAGGRWYIDPMATNASATPAGRNPKVGPVMATKATKVTSAPAPAPRASISAQVVEMRNVQLLSWAQIGQALGFAPRTARRLYQESAGAHQHHGLLPGKGGRLPKGFVTATPSALVAPGSGTWAPRTEAPAGIAGTKGSAVVVPAAPAPKVRAPRKPKVAK